MISILFHSTLIKSKKTLYVQFEFHEILIIPSIYICIYHSSNIQINQFIKSLLRHIYYLKLFAIFIGVIQHF